MCGNVVSTMQTPGILSVGSVEKKLTSVVSIVSMGSVLSEGTMTNQREFILYLLVCASGIWLGTIISARYEYHSAHPTCCRCSGSGSGTAPTGAVSLDTRENMGGVGSGGDQAAPKSDPGKAGYQGNGTHIIPCTPIQYGGRPIGKFTPN